MIGKIGGGVCDMFGFVSFNVDPSDRGLLCRGRETSDLTVQIESEDNFQNSVLRYNDRRCCSEWMV